MRPRPPRFSRRFIAPLERQPVVRDESSWAGPGMPDGRRRISWNALLWSLVYPARSQRNLPTISGAVLVALLAGIGMAAYNSANNILFITLSLLASSFIVSGVLSWMNFRGLCWRWRADPPLRVGQPHMVRLEVRNRKRFLPSYGLWFDVAASRAGVQERLFLPERLDPGEEKTLEWSFVPAQRGEERFELRYVGSLFPFGFLKKSLATRAAVQTVVWPAAVEYRRYSPALLRHTSIGDPTERTGSGNDLFAIRPYQSGDSHRRIHWKATARLRELMVREFSDERQEGFSLWLDTAEDHWPRAEQFELLCRFVATLAEDLFTAGKLSAVSIGEGPLVPVRRLRDLETFLDGVALARPSVNVSTRPSTQSDRLVPEERRGVGRRQLLTFAADGPRGVAAFLNGEKTAAA